MRPTSLTLADPSATRERLLGLAAQVPGARVGVKSAALLLLLAGQRAGWISEVLGLTRMSLSRWIHGVNAEGVEHLMPKSRPGRPAGSPGMFGAGLPAGIAGVLQTVTQPMHPVLGLAHLQGYAEVSLQMHHQGGAVPLHTIQPEGLGRGPQMRGKLLAEAPV